jgi:hypothetical protein
MSNIGIIHMHSYDCGVFQVLNQPSQQNLM